MDTQPEILFEEIKGKKGDVGLITLNRPKALNALTYNMCRLMNEQLAEWEEEDYIKAVIIQGAGDKAFCAGGDIRKIYELGINHKYDEAMLFFAEEYRLNAKIHNFKKPYIAILDGITMGGGMGVSIHGSHRIATERMTMAMPETSIGFFPDIGGSYFLSRCPDEVGTYLALTGAHINAVDAAYADLIDGLVSSTHCQEIIQMIAATPLGDEPRETVSNILKEFAVYEEFTPLKQFRESIEECFSQSSIESIITHLKKHKGEWHTKAAETLSSKSPTSLKVTLAQLRNGVGLDIHQCLRMEYNMVAHFLRQHDFYEGIRAMLVSKDKNPKWNPSTLDKVSKDFIEDVFIPLDGMKALEFDIE